MDRHPLRREIITTAVVNDVVNASGSTFVFRMNEETGASSSDIARAYLVARDVFQMPRFWDAVESLSHQVEESTQVAMRLEARKLTERAARWLLHNRRPRSTYRRASTSSAAAPPPSARTCRNCSSASTWPRSSSAATASPNWASRTNSPSSAPRSSRPTPRSTWSASRTRRAARWRRSPRCTSTSRTASSCPGCGRIIALPRDDKWRTLARSALRDDLYAAHSALTRDVLITSESGGRPEERMIHWAEKNKLTVQRAQQTLSEIWESDSFDLATLSVALGAIRTLVTASSLPSSEA